MKVNHQIENREALQHILNQMPVNEIPTGISFDFSYTANLHDFSLDEVLCDDNGAFRNYSTKDKYYAIELDKNKIKHMQKVNRLFSSSNKLFLIRRYYYCSLSQSKFKKKIIQVKEISQEKDFINACLVIYHWENGKVKKFSPKPHGNSKKNTRPYNRKNKKLLQKLKNETVNSKNLNNLYDKFIKNSAKNTPLSSLPSGTKQLRNHKFLKAIDELKKKGLIQTKDEVYDIINNMTQSKKKKNIFLSTDLIF